MAKEKKLPEGVEDIDGLDIYVSEEGENYPLVPDEEWLPAILNVIRKRKMKFGPTLEAEFLLQDEYEGRRVRGLMGMVASLPTDQRPKGSKLYDWYTRITGVQLKKNDPVDLKSLFGRKVEVFIENSPNTKGDRIFQNVTKVRGVSNSAAEEDTPTKTKTRKSKKKTGKKVKESQEEEPQVKVSDEFDIESIGEEDFNF